MRLLLAVAAIAFASPTLAADMSRAAHCVQTKVTKVETRLMDGSTGQPIPGSGSAIQFANGLYQVGYDQIAAVDQSLPGDPVRVCLVSVPKHCPAGDHRGRIYHTTNLRTHGAWTLPDSEHSCGGA